MLCILSDIHGYIDRLDAIIVDARAKGATEFWCLGDIVGRGGASKQAWQKIQKQCSLILAGNHDLGLIGERVRLDVFSPTDRAALLEARNYLLGDEAFRALSPVANTTYQGQDVCAVHGSPADPTWGMVDGVGAAFFAFQKTQARLIVCGHTHVPRVLDDAPKEYAEETVALDANKRYILNPGAVMYGQYALLDNNVFSRHNISI